VVKYEKKYHFRIQPSQFNNFKGVPLPKKSQKFCFFKECKFIRHSKGNVKFSRFENFDSKILYGHLGEKKLKITKFTHF
jgi:hypothetical protein